MLWEEKTESFEKFKLHEMNSCIVDGKARRVY